MKAAYIYLWCRAATDYKCTSKAPNCKIYITASIFEVICKWEHFPKYTM